MNFWQKIKSKIPVMLLSGLTVFGVSSSENKKSDITNNQLETAPKTEVITSKVKNPVTEVFYRTDTIENRSPILLYNDHGNIIRHYKAGDDLYLMQLYLFIHEAWHTHNLKTGFKDKYRLSPKQLRNLLSHDEISANLVSLNSLILEYTLSDNKAEFLKKFDNNRFYSFYFKEVAKNNINPLSTDSLMIEKDRKLRINGIIKAWMERSYKSYSSRQENMLFNYIRRFGLYPAHNKNYQNILHKMYTIGGIDFWKYAEKDIDINDADLYENLSAVKSFSKNSKLTIEEIKKHAPLLELFNDRSELLFAIQHLVISAEIKAKIIANNYDVNDKIVNILYNKTRTKYHQDKSFIDFVYKTSLLYPQICINNAKHKISLPNFIHKIYTFNGKDLSENINNFNPTNLPYRQDNTSFNYEAESPEIFIWNDLDEILASETQLSRNENSANNETAKPLVGTHLRRSAIQSVKIPNFEEPILIALTEQQRKLLKQTYINFADSVQHETTHSQNLKLKQNPKRKRER